jgi:hypothetical protein
MDSSGTARGEDATAGQSGPSVGNNQGSETGGTIVGDFFEWLGGFTYKVTYAVVAILRAIFG